MNYLLLSAAAAALIASGASAQSAQPHSRNPAVKDNTVAHVRAPAQGRSSFTEAQARGRIVKAGYARVSGLAKDRSGVWRGTAVRRGKPVHVGLDYKGNVTAR